VFATVYVESDVDVWEKHDASGFDREDGSTFTRNVGNRIHFRKMSAPKNRVNIDTDRSLNPEIGTAGREAEKISYNLSARKLQCVVKKCSVTTTTIDEGVGANLFWLRNSSYCLLLGLVIEFFLQEDILISVLVAYTVLQQTNV
jgi:hypothetical protein